MQSEKERILDMVENGTISAREAVELLRAIDGSSSSSNEPNYGRNNQKDKSAKRGFFRPEDIVKKVSKDFSKNVSKNVSKNAPALFYQFPSGYRTADALPASDGKGFPD